MGDPASPSVRLVETIELERSTMAYMTLSHCWGHHIPVRLLTDNYSSSLKGMELSDLPKTYRDAIMVTQNLGVAFLWIDSLCIIQDSALDWANESSKMKQVFQNSCLNLAAGASQDSTGGLFYPRSPLGIAPCEVKVGRGANAKFARSIYSPEASRNELVLFTRGWVFQELLLAPRILLFGKKELYWECNEVSGSEIYPEGIVTLENEETMRLANLRKDWRKIYNKSPQMRWEIWCQVVNEYSKRNLTRFSDKLVAVAGLAADLGKIWVRVDYFAGIWAYRLRRGLLWCCNQPRHSLRLSYTAPSWSWASVDGTVYTNHETQFIDGLVKVLDANVQLSMPSNPYSAVTDGYIRIKGPMLQAKIIKVREEQRVGVRWYIVVFDGWTETEEEEVLDQGFRMKIEAYVQWDDRALEDMIEAVRVYMVPFEISLLPSDLGLELEGLILLPTFVQAGQFRRVGSFRVADYWRNRYEDKNMSDVESSCDSPSDLEAVPEEIRGLEGCSQVRPAKRPGQPQAYVTLLEAVVWLKDQAPLCTTTLQEARSTGDDKRTRKVKKWMIDLTKTMTQDSEDSEKGQSCDNDPYGNGIINKTLKDRYGRDMRNDYLHINSLLTWAFAKFDIARENDLLSDEMCEECHGDGYFTFQIV